MIKEQLKVVADAYRKLKSEYVLGMTSDKMRKVFLSAIKDSLGDCAVKYDFLCGKETLNIDGVTKGFVPKTGDTVLIDISVRTECGWSDVCRTFFIGEPTEDMIKKYELITRSIRSGEKALKAGIKACDIYSAVNAEFIKSGYTLVHHAGHKIGTRALMQPQFLLDKTKKIKKGEYFTIESGLYDGCGIRLENDYFINHGGAENLFEDLLPLDIKEYILQ